MEAQRQGILLGGHCDIFQVRNYGAYIRTVAARMLGKDGLGSTQDTDCPTGRAWEKECDQSLAWVESESVMPPEAE